MTTKNITIAGGDIIGTDGSDHTGALKELGVSHERGENDQLIYSMTFQVDLDFVTRHGLIDARISRQYYKGTPEYLRYYNEGKDAYLGGKDEYPNPYSDRTVNDADYWYSSLHHKCHPWYDGYRETQAAAMEEKYHIGAFQDEVRGLIAKYGLILKYCDEYNNPYAETPEGYPIKLA